MDTIRHTYRLFALTIAALMLSTSIGLAVDMHFCDGKLVSISFFGEADTCKKPGSGKAGCLFHNEGDLRHHQLQISKKACCEDRFFQIKADQNLKPERLNWDLQKPEMPPNVALNTLVVPLQPSNQFLSLNAFYQSPFLCRALHILGQSFLL